MSKIRVESELVLVGETSFGVEIITNASKVLEKSNGSEYVLFSVKGIEDPFMGDTFTAQFTLKEGVDTPKKGDNVTLFGKRYNRVDKATSEILEENIFFYDIGTVPPTTDNDDIGNKWDQYL